VWWGNSDMSGTSARFEAIAGEEGQPGGAVSPACPERALPDRVLIVSQWFWPELIGTGFYSGDLGFWLAGQGTKVEVVTNRPSYPGSSIFPEYRSGRRDRENAQGVLIERLPTWVAPSGRALHRIASEFHFLLRSIPRLWRRRLGPRGAVVSFCPSVMAVLAASLVRGRHVAVVHDIQSGLAQSLALAKSGAVAGILRRVERFSLNRADQIIVLSDEMRAVLRSLGVHRPIAVVPIWVDTTQFQPLPRLHAAAPTVVYSGNFGRKQGLDQVLDCAEILKRELPEAVVVLRGGGSTEADLRRDVASRGLGNIRFEPLLPAERLAEGLAAADLMLVPQEPSASDFAVPSKIYTIMAAGRPMVATAREGSPLWKLAQACGGIHCVPPRDPQAFAQAVLGLMRDPERRQRMGAAARRYAVQEVDRERVLAQLAALLATLPNGHTRRELGGGRTEGCNNRC
jgi:colanic acid biosynthesis glycosyl transferase WcaI